MNTSRTAHINGPSGFHSYTYLAPIKFTAFEGTGATGPSFNFLGFCVDIFHGISLGTLNLKYDDNFDLTTNSKYLSNTPFAGGTSLSGQQKLQVGRLVNYGTLIYDQAPNTAVNINKLAALQGAVWQVINPGYAVTSGNGAVNSLIATYSGTNYNAALTGFGHVHSGITFITETEKYGTRSAHQSFAIAAVPEPSTWAVMILGFGLTGAVLRRRQFAMIGA